ncbi:hypothetical protein EP331_12740 [bacterium]|nr:MAG: hypothetical protein EP331_12740 [bacterium]
MKRLLFFISILICFHQQAYSQYLKDSMRGLNNVHVGAIPFSRLAVDAGVNTHAFIGKIEREMASIGAYITSEQKSNGSVILDLDLSPVSNSGYAYMIRIRFMKKINLRVKNRPTEKMMWVTLWERKGIGYTSKMKANGDIMTHFEHVLNDFIADYSEGNN